MIVAMRSILLLIFAAYSSARSTGAANCKWASSYTHGKDPTPGTGGYHISVESGSADGGPLQISVKGSEPFKGVLLYTNLGQLNGLPETLQFKTSCDEERGVKRTVTHVSSSPKSEVSLGLDLPTGEANEIVINAVVLKDVREWYWINVTFS